MLTRAALQLVFGRPPAALRYGAPSTAPDPRHDDAPPLARVVGRRDGAALVLLGAPDLVAATWIMTLHTAPERVAENVRIGGTLLGALYADGMPPTAWYTSVLQQLVAQGERDLLAETADHRLRIVFNAARGSLLLHCMAGPRWVAQERSAAVVHDE